MEGIGLALGGGAVLGAAHVGVLKAIDECDIQVKYVSGTSIGAVVAAFYAFGKDCQEIGEIASELKWMDITKISLSRYGLLSNEKLGDLMREHIGDQQIEDAKIPLAMVATDVTTGERVVMDKGSVIDAVMASTCIPGIFNPIKREDQLLVDGGIVENVPISTVKGLGADYIVGVDLNAKHKYDKPDNILEVITNSFHLLMKQSVSLQTEEADLLIKPDLTDFSRSDMNQIGELIDKGYEDAISVLKEMSD